MPTIKRVLAGDSEVVTSVFGLSLNLIGLEGSRKMKRLSSLRVLGKPFCGRTRAFIDCAALDILIQRPAH